MRIENGAVAWESEPRDLPVIGLAVHAGHELREEIADIVLLDEDERRYEEDPGTEVFARLAPIRGIALRSRFEVDLNRTRDKAVYLEPEEAWGLDLWRRRPPQDEIDLSLALYDDFYARLDHEIEELLRRHERVVVLDFHSYNHRRDRLDRMGARENPDVNVGTGSLDRSRWGPLVDGFMERLSEVGSLDVRENARFLGRAVAAFVNERFPGRAFCLALELKKTYMDEHTGEIFPEQIQIVTSALSASLPALTADRGRPRGTRPAVEAPGPSSEAPLPLEDELPAEEPVRRSLPRRGRLNIDRPLPVLVLYRHRPNDVGTGRLVEGTGSYLIAGDVEQNELEGTIEEIVEPLADRFGAFLLLEIWSAEPRTSPRVRILAEPQEGREPEIASLLVRELQSCASVPPVAGKVALEQVSPPGFSPALRSHKRQEHGCHLIGIEMPPIYRGPEGSVFPDVLRTMTRELSHVLNRVVFEFAQVHTSYRPRDFRELGRRTVLETGWKIDERLAGIGNRLGLLLNITPVNGDAAWEEFRESNYRREPIFHYRPLPFDPDLVKRDLFDLPIEEVEDPNITFLLREKRSELDRVATMLGDRNTPRFLQGSIALYGGVDRRLISEARRLLRATSPEPVIEWVSSVDFARRAKLEIDCYRRRWRDFEAEVEIRPDVPGVMVVHGSLLIGAKTRIRAERVDPLIHHEIGTHLVTRHNGAAQALKMLSVGLPGYEQTQEGLAVLAELLSGGLGFDRLRTLAARVLAVHRMIEGRSFTEVFAELHGDLGVEPKASWMLTMRVFRSGGLTKDAMYLQGLLDVLDHLSSGGPLEPLFLGKMALQHIPLIEELLWRRILVPARVQPRWLEEAPAKSRLERIRNGSDLLELVA